MRLMTLIGLQPLGDVRAADAALQQYRRGHRAGLRHLPFMVLPLYSALDRHGPLADGSEPRSGRRPHAHHLVKVVVPLAAPGIASGVLITFIPALGAYLTPDLLGGPDSQMIANVIERQFKRANNWPFGAALSFLLMYLTFIAIAVAGAGAAQSERRA